MKTAGLICNYKNTLLSDALFEVTKILSEKKVALACPPEAKEHIALNNAKSLSDVTPNFIIALGGDGTILKACDFAAKNNIRIPLLGVNQGRIGFLSAIELSELSTAIDLILSDNMQTEKRMMLSCRVSDKEFIALNDFILYKQFFSGTAHINITVNGDDVGNVFCDGIIISTPTGSTAYSLSAGGSVVASGLDVILITPVCSHSFSIRPIVCSPDSVLEFTLLSEGELGADGSCVYSFSPGEKLNITRSDKICEMFVLHKKNVLKMIRDKLT